METFDLHFPFAGTDVSQAFGRQPNRPAVRGQYARTTPVGKNVRSFDALDRARGGIRPGLTRYIAYQPGGSQYVTQHLSVLTRTGGSPVQSSQSGRQVELISVAAGVVYYVEAGGTTWTAATNATGQTPALNITGLMQSTANNQQLFIVDGTNAIYYSPVDHTLRLWTATEGTFPVDSDGNKPRLICTWRGRNVVAGWLKDPSLICMTKVSEPFNFNYAPALPVPPDAAWSGNIGPQGYTGDVITALIPYSDDTLIVGMDSSLAVFRGDPNYGGQIDLVTTTIGIAWGRAWCMDPSGVVYFFSNRTGVFAFVPGNQPQRISQAIDNLLKDINTGLYGVLMQWNDRYQQLHVWVTLLAAQGTTTHYVWESRANAWWQDTFANNAHNPLACVTFDGNLPADRVSLIGGWTGYVYSISSSATTDDGTAINSEVWIGPFLTKFNDSVMLKEAQGVLGEASGEVSYAVYVGDTAEDALGNTAVASGTWSASRNFTDAVMRAGHAAYIQITASTAWAMESIRCIVGTQGKIRQRGK